MVVLYYKNKGFEQLILVAILRPNYMIGPFLRPNGHIQIPFVNFRGLGYPS